MTPPPVSPSIIHKVRLLHKDIYIIGQKLSKRDKLGIHADVERLGRELLVLGVTAAFSAREGRKPIVEQLRVKIEACKHLTRTECELGVIEEKAYLRISAQLIEISKMASGWVRFLTQKGAP